MFSFLFHLFRRSSPTRLPGRSPQWPEVRRVHLALHPRCAVCNGREDIEVHHVLPYYRYPEQELSPGNLITLCNHLHHHLTFGHLCNYQSWNPFVVSDAASFRRKMEDRPR